VATKTRGKSWLKTIVIFVFTPIAIWLIVFLLWIYWHDLANLLNIAKDGSRAPSQGRQKIESGNRENRQGPQEKILDEERKKLEEILKDRR